MVRCAVLVSALLLASVSAPADSQSGMYTKIYRQRRPYSMCSSSYLVRAINYGLYTFITNLCYGLRMHTYELDHYPECPRTRVQIITRNTTLLSLSNITATRFYGSLPPSYFGNFTPAVWCAPPGPNPNVSLTFSQLVLITGFIPGGFSRNDGSNREYVTNFNLRYSQTLDGNDFSSPQVRH